MTAVSPHVVSGVSASRAHFPWPSRGCDRNTETRRPWSHWRHAQQSLISWRCPVRNRAVIGPLRSFHNAPLSKEPTSAGCLNRHWDAWDACLVQKDHITDWFGNDLWRKVSQFSVFKRLFSSVFVDSLFWKHGKQGGILLALCTFAKVYWQL